MERKLIAAAVSCALALPMAAQAVEFSVSGHVNRAIIRVDGDGNDGDLRRVDANAPETRVRFEGIEEFGSGLPSMYVITYQSYVASALAPRLHGAEPSKGGVFYQYAGDQSYVASALAPRLHGAESSKGGVFYQYAGDQSYVASALAPRLHGAEPSKGGVFYQYAGDWSYVASALAPRLHGAESWRTGYSIGGLSTLDGASYAPSNQLQPVGRVSAIMLNR